MHCSKRCLHAEMASNEFFIVCLMRARFCYT